MTEGILYICSGTDALYEAERSAKLIKNQTKNYPIGCICDEKLEEFDIFDVKINRESKCQNGGYKHRQIHHTPFDKTIYFDTDVWVFDPNAITEMLQMLDKFDIVGRVDTGRRQELYHGEALTNEDVPRSFPMINGGVLGFKSNNKIMKMFCQWRQAFRNYEDRMDNPPDQPGLRKAIYNSEAQLAPIPPEYNFRLPYPHYIVGDVKIIHGRGQNLNEIYRDINTETSTPWHGRIYSPSHSKSTNYSRWYNPSDEYIYANLGPDRLSDLIYKFRSTINKLGIIRGLTYSLFGGPARGPSLVHKLIKSIDDDGLKETISNIIKYLHN